MNESLTCSWPCANCRPRNGPRLWTSSVGTIPRCDPPNRSLTQSLPILYTLAAIFGIGLGGVLTAYAVIIRERIPPHLNGRSVGVVSFFGYAALGVGGYVGGVLYDWTGNYSATYTSGTITGFASVTVQVLLMIYFMRRQTLARAVQPA